MADPYLGEIRMFGGNYAPEHWAFCNGQLLAISDHQSLYSLIGTIYGGDGQVSFGLPDFRGRVPVHQGNGPGLADYALGQRGGVETVSLRIDNMPAHGHAIEADSRPNTSGDATNGFFGPTSGQDPDFSVYTEPKTTVETLDSRTLSEAGEGDALYNIAPFVCINFIIALKGVYPSRS